MMKITSFPALVAIAVIASFYMPSDAQAASGEVASALHTQTMKCWDGVGDLAFAKTQRVRIAIELSANGELVRPLEVLTPVGDAAEHPEMIVAVNRAMRAVSECVPYTIPANGFEWPKPIILNFGPPLTPDSMF